MYEAVRQFNGPKINRANLNRMVDICNRSRPRSTGGYIHTSAGSVITSGTSQPTTTSTSPWAASITGAQVTISPGFVLVLGKQAQLLSGALVASGGSYSSPNWIVCLVNRATGAAELSIQASQPNPANRTHIEWPLHQIYMASGTAVILRTLEKGVIFVGSLT